MPWATRTDLERAIGTRELLDLADLDNEGSEAAAVASRIETAIAAAESEVKSYVRGRLDADSLDPVPAVLVEKVVTLAVHHLQKHGRRETLTEQDGRSVQQARAWLRDYADGRAGLDLPPTSQAGAVRDPIAVSAEAGANGVLYNLLEGY